MKLLIAAIFSLVCMPIMALTPYAQLSSDKDQAAGSGNIVQMEQVDGVSGILVHQGLSSTLIEVEKAGLYIVIAAPQSMAIVGCLDLWFRVNDEDVDNSNVRLCQTDENQTDVIISQGALCLAKRDKLKIVMSGTGIESTKPTNEPLIPAIIFTMYYAGNCN